MTRETPPPSDAEWKALNALWRRHPASARDLLKALSEETGWAYTTLKTILTRLEEKGLVRTVMRGNTAWYEPAIERRKAQRDAVRALIERVFEGAAGPFLAHLVDEERLSGSERRKLEGWIAEVEKKEGRRERR